jgi:phospholipase C
VLFSGVEGTLVKTGIGGVMNRFEASFFSAALLLFITGCSGSVGSVPAPGPSAPSSKVIQHVLILVQENRSFENIFAGFPGANAPMQGLCKPVPPKTPWCKVAREVPLKPVALESNHLPGGMDICHSHQCFNLECDIDASKICKMDGFNLIDFGEVQGGEPAKLYPYAYVERTESKPYWDLAKQYALADDMYSTDTASSFIAHQELIAGTVRLNDEESLTDQPDDTPWGCDAPPGTQVPILLKDGTEIMPPNKRTPFPCFTEYETMADLFSVAHTSWKYYVYPMFGTGADFSGDVWNAYDAIKKVRYDPSEWSHMSMPTTTLFTDLKKGTLPQVSWVIPTLCDSDHPGSGANRGPRWITQVVNAIGTSQYWKSTAIILLWDDWGGWYDNSPPPQINYTSLGMRVPMIVISPYAKPHSISHTEYNIGSILKFIEETFGLGSLGTTDATANSISDLFNFSQTPLKFTPSPLPHVLSCPSISSEEFIKINGAPPG